MEYEVGDVFEVEGTWYGGVHISGRTGIPVSLDKDEYVELEELPEKTEADPKQEKPAEAAEKAAENIPERDIRIGDIVQHFKREWVSGETSEYLYKVLAFAEHTETGEKFVVYQALYAPFKTCARPYAMFMSEVDKVKYPNVKQTWRFEKAESLQAL